MSSGGGTNTGEGSSQRTRPPNPPRLDTKLPLQQTGSTPITGGPTTPIVPVITTKSPSDGDSQGTPPPPWQFILQTSSFTPDQIKAPKKVTESTLNLLAALGESNEAFGSSL